MTGSGRAPVRLHIDRLVLDGLALGPGGEARFQTALTETLSAMLSAQGLSLGATKAPPHATLRPGAAPPVRHEGSPEALGRAVARRVHAQLTQASAKRPEAAR